MLKFFRNNRALLITLFIICGGAMVFVLIGGPGGGGGHTAGLKGTAANVNGEKISVQDLTQEVNQRWAQAQRRLDEQFPLGEANSAQNRRFMEQLIRQQYSPERVLDSLIHDRYFYSLTKDNRVAVSDEAVRQYLYQIPAFQKDGRFDPIAYRQMISRPGDFEGDITRQLAKDAFLQQFAVSLRHISAGEKEILDSLNEARVFETVTLNAKSISAAKKPSEAELSQWQETEEAKKAVKAYFEENKSKYDCLLYTSPSPRDNR